MMKSVQETVDVVVAGGGTAGHIAAIQAARAGVTTAVIEAGSMLGGTMTSGGVYMPNHFFSPHGPVVQGIPWELYKKSKEIEGLEVPDYRKDGRLNRLVTTAISTSRFTQPWRRKRPNKPE